MKKFIVPKMELPSVLDHLEKVKDQITYIVYQYIKTKLQYT